MKYQKGNFKVVRDCCHSGHCFECRTFRGKVEVVQGDGYSKEFAEFVAKNWKSYKARVEPMENHNARQ